MVNPGCHKPTFGGSFSYVRPFLAALGDTLFSWSYPRQQYRPHLCRLVFLDYNPGPVSIDDTQLGRFVVAKQHITVYDKSSFCWLVKINV